MAISIDGTSSGRGRLIHNAYLDVRQVEVLKGPQSLYFGKSATAGVISIKTNDPSDTQEIKASVAYETEHDSTYSEFILSSPVTDNFGARLALGLSRSDELYESIHPDASKRFRGEESTSARLTLTWQPNEDFKSSLKISYSEYENDDPIGNTETFCPEGQVQPTAIIGNNIILTAIDDCRLNGNTSISDAMPVLASGLPEANGGVPYLEQQTDLYSLRLDWEINASWSLTSITSYLDLSHQDYAVYDFSTGIGAAALGNDHQSKSQEFRLASNSESRFNVAIGAYYQEVEQTYVAHQSAVSIAVAVGPDSITGRGYDYLKDHLLEADVKSVFVAGYWDITPQLELTAGLRYTEEEKQGRIFIPYVHEALRALFDTPELVDGLEFKDNNTSPEVSAVWYFNDGLSAYVAYKEGFKSGGIDNSALPGVTLVATNPEFPRIFDL